MIGYLLTIFTGIPHTIIGILPVITVTACTRMYAITIHITIIIHTFTTTHILTTNGIRTRTPTTGGPDNPDALPIFQALLMGA
jgi:hypothetical protein